MNIFGLFEKRVADALGRLAEAGKIPSGLDVRRVADYIAGMTDRYAILEHRRLFDVTPDLR